MLKKIYISLIIKVSSLLGIDIVLIFVEKGKPYVKGSDNLIKYINISEFIRNKTIIRRIKVTNINFGK